MTEPSQTSPEWAVAFARGALRIGMSVPEIEQRLVEKGLSPEDANAIVMALIEGAVLGEMEANTSAGTGGGRLLRLGLSALIGGACVLLAFGFGSRISAIWAIVWVVPALLGIWIAELTDMADSDWGRSWCVSGWGVLLIYLSYRIFWAVITA